MATEEKGKNTVWILSCRQQLYCQFFSSLFCIYYCKLGESDFKRHLITCCCQGISELLWDVFFFNVPINIPNICGIAQRFELWVNPAIPRILNWAFLTLLHVERMIIMHLVKFQGQILLLSHSYKLSCLDLWLTIWINNWNQTASCQHQG